MTLPECHCDVETRATVDLRKSGVYVYAEHKDTDVWCMSYRFGNTGPVSRWRMGEPCPADIADHVKNNGIFCCFNAAFERIIWWNILTPRYGWPKPKIEQFRCVMIQAMAMSLPASLENAALALGIQDGKDMQGHRLMMQMCRPRKVLDDGTLIWWDDAERLEKLYAYCDSDVIAETEVDRRTVPLRESEQKLWYLDQKINDRGVKVDTKLCHQARKIVQDTTDKLDKEMREVTDREVSSLNAVQQLLIWLRAKGIDTDSVDKESVVDMLALDTLPTDVRRAIELRQEGGKSSTAKIEALLNCINKDGRARGLIQFHGANTGRWAGRRFQPHNLTRPEMEHPEEAVPALMTGDAKLVEMLYDKPLSVVSDCSRSLIVAG